MAKTLQDIKDWVANDNGWSSWESATPPWIDSRETERLMDEVSIRYSQEQNKQLQEWKESMMTIHNELDLQGIGKALELPLGSSIAPQVLPNVKELVEQNKELVEMLERVYNETNHNTPLYPEILILINKHKGGKS